MRRRRTGPGRAGPRLGAALLAVAAGVPAARGDDPPAPPDASPPEVTREVEPVVTEAVRPGRVREDPTSFTTVIEPEAFRGEQKDLADLVGRSVGVQVRRLGGPGQRSEVSIRGSTSSQVVILLDGVRLNSAQSGAVDLSTIPVDLVERVEISRGGGSAQVGSDAIGGVINVITRRAGDPRTRLAGAAESFGTGEGSLFHGGSLGPLEYALGYRGFTTLGDYEFQRPIVRFGGAEIPFDPPSLRRINNQAVSHAGLLKLGADLGERVRVELINDLFRTSRGRPGLDTDPGTLGGQRPNAHERLFRHLAQLSADVADLGPADLRLQVYHRLEDVRFTDPDPRPGGVMDPIDTTNRNQALGGRAALEGGGRLAGIDHRMLLAVDWRQDRLLSDEFDDTERNTLGIFYQHELALFERRVRVVPALRLDDTDGLRLEWLPRVGVVLEPLRWLRIKGNWEESYRAPNFDELFFPDKGFIRGNPGLLPEEARNADVGLEVAVEKLGFVTDLRFEVAGFYNDIENSIVFLLISPNTVAPVNTGPATAWGVEASLAFRLFDWVGVAVNHTELETELAANGAPLPGRAGRETAGRLEIGPASGLFQLVGEAQFTDDIPVTDTGASFISDRLTFDASLSVNLARLGFVRDRLPLDDLRVTVGGRNLTDQAVRDALFFPQPGRVLYVSGEVGW